MSGFWVKLITEFIIAISWQLTVVIALLLFKKEIREIIKAVAERGFKGEIGPVKAEIPQVPNFPEPEEKTLPQDPKPKRNFLTNPTRSVSRDD